jgi:electron transfer flavoprotein beta subunit
MEWLLDTADPEKISEGIRYYPVSGVTTNPTILKRAAPADYFAHLKALRALCVGKTLHVQLGSQDAEGMLREVIAMGVDEAVLISGREFGGSDTFATSQIIAAAIDTYGVDSDDIIFCGRQAIDGDTAQVGPQVAQKLGMTQVTYAQEILKVENGKALIRRVIDGGVETVEAPLPLVVTVNGSAAPCRPQNVRLVMKYKWATCPSERPENDPHAALYEERPYLTLTQWTVADVDGDPSQCGFAGSPTRVKSVQNIVFQAKESKTLTASDADVESLVRELLSEKIIG